MNDQIPRSGTPAPDETGGDLLTVHEVAQMLRVPDATVRYWRSYRLGPPSFKIGRHVRYARADVLSWLGQQRAVDDPGAA